MGVKMINEKQQAIKARYENLQQIALNCSKYGCFFCSLLSIIEEYTGKKLDIIDSYYKCINAKVMNDNFLVLDKVKLLELFTIDYVHFRLSKNINEKIADNEYTIIKYSKNGKTHFKRKYIQTYKNSSLTNSKYFECLYIFSFDYKF